MPELVCRIQWRKGLPLGLSISRRTSFLDLPQDIRDNVYHHSLVVSESITVWSRTHGDDDNTLNFPGNVTLRSWKTVNTSETVIDCLTLSLLRCNRQVSCEAAAILYRRNIFRFMGANSWNSLYVFLQMIGEENKRNFRNLEMEILTPKPLWQHPDGTLTTLHSWRFREVTPFDPRFQSNSTPIVPGLVDRLDLAIEACFRIFGKDRSSLTLILILNKYYLPGVQVMFDEQYEYCFSLDLPLMIENFRQDLIANPGATSQVEVLWKGECLRDYFANQMGLIQESGCVIIDAKERYIHYDTYPIHAMLFTLRRKELRVTSFPADTNYLEQRSWMIRSACICSPVSSGS